jgi:hypothetical protein
VSSVEQSHGDGELCVVIAAKYVHCSVHRGGAWTDQTYKKQEIHGEPDKAAVESDLTVALDGLRIELLASGVRAKRTVVLISELWLGAAIVPWRGGHRTELPSDTTVRQYLVNQGFELGTEDIVRWESTPYGQPRMVVAYPGQVLESLHRIATDIGGVLASVLPTGIAAWFGLKRKSPSQILSVVDEGWLQLMQSIDGKYLSGVSTRRVEGHGINLLSAQWQRWRMQVPSLLSVEKLSVANLSICTIAAGSVPGNVELVEVTSSGSSNVHLNLQLCLESTRISKGLNALLRKKIPFISQLSICVLALLFVMIFAINALSVQSELRVLSSKWSEHEKLVIAKPLPKVFSNEDRIRILEVNQAIRELNLPIEKLLIGLQPPQDIHVEILNIDLQAASAENSPVIKVLAKAKSNDDMMLYVGFLGSHKPFANSYLTRHEVLETEAGAPIQFRVEAPWVEQ